MIVSIDFETYYDREYSLSKISEVEYVLDPRFETIMCAVKIDNKPTNTYVGKRAVASALSHINWESAALLAHNNRFDGAILAWHYGHVPRLYLDTLSMARATTHWNIGRSSLKAVSDYLGLPPKGDEVVRAIGKRLRNFAPDELAAYRSYCERDNENCYDIFQIMRPCFSNEELQLIDLVMRMYVLPQVQLDRAALSLYLDELQAEKAAIMAEIEQLTLDRSVFSSNIKFADLLRELGVELPMKVSPTTGEEIPALAKNDRGFRDLLQDENQPTIVQCVLAARMATKSTLEETRTRRLINLAETTWPVQGVGWGPVPLKYSGARTHRFSGDDGTNWLNFRRGSKIKAGICAPSGYRVVHRDSSQIEARMVAWLARCGYLVNAFAEGVDVYCQFASEIYNRVVTRDDTLERFVGKTGILSLNYAAGPARFRHMLFVGNGGVSVNVTLEQAERIVYRYRDLLPEIPNLWTAGEHLLRDVTQVSGRPAKNVSRIVHDNQLYPKADGPVQVGFDSLWLPSGLCISYPGIHAERTPEGAELFYDDPYGGKRKIYGAKCIENISQALSRIIVTSIAVRVYQYTGYHPFLCTYDSLDYVVPLDQAADMDERLEHEFSQVPSWAQGLPLASEGGWGASLLEAEKGANQ
jgi:DNA polymerase